MTKYIYLAITLIIIGLIISLSITYRTLQTTKEQVGKLETSLNACTVAQNDFNAQLIKYNNANIEANKTIFELRRLNNVKEEKQECNCYDTRISNSILELLHDDGTSNSENKSE